MHRGRWSLALVALVTGLALAASVGFVAAQGHGNRVGGTIQSVDAAGFTVAARNGNTTVVKTTAATKIFTSRKATFEEIRQGDSVRVIAKQASDGSLSAIAVQSAPGNMQNQKGGRRSGRSGNIMISGIAGRPTGTGTGRTLMVTYPGGNATVNVPQDARIARVEALPAGGLKTGMHVFVNGNSNPDGSITASTIMVQGPRQQ
jgi:Cu/Ag efflux protein CusF